MGKGRGQSQSVWMWEGGKNERVREVARVKREKNDLSKWTLKLVPFFYSIQAILNCNKAPKTAKWICDDIPIAIAIAQVLWWKKKNDDDDDYNDNDFVDNDEGAEKCMFAQKISI